MCHLMPPWHMPEWREEDEPVFVHCGSSGQPHATKSNLVYHIAFQGVIRHFTYVPPDAMSAYARVERGG